MGIVLFIVFGLFIGLVARGLMPGNQQMGFIMTIALGIAGSFVGGALAGLVTSQGITEFHNAGVVGSLIGALMILFVATVVTRRYANL